MALLSAASPPLLCCGVPSATTVCVQGTASSCLDLEYPDLPVLGLEAAFAGRAYGEREGGSGVSCSEEFSFFVLQAD